MNNYGVHNRIVWQIQGLSQTSFDFHVLLNRSFAKEMLEIDFRKGQVRMNSLGESLIKKSKYYNESSPYIFEGNSALVRQINLNSGQGIWLALEGQFGQIPDLSRPEPLRYTPNNMDSIHDTVGLLKLFDLYIFYSNIFKDFK